MLEQSKKIFSQYILYFPIKGRFKNLVCKFYNDRYKTTIMEQNANAVWLLSLYSMYADVCICTYICVLIYIIYIYYELNYICIYIQLFSFIIILYYTIQDDTTGIALANLCPSWSSPYITNTILTKLQLLPSSLKGLRLNIDWVNSTPYSWVCSLSVLGFICAGPT